MVCGLNFFLFILLLVQVILMILAANAAVGVITETNAENALEVSHAVLHLLHCIITWKHLEKTS